MLAASRAGARPVADAVKLQANVLCKWAVPKQRRLGHNRGFWLRAWLVDVAGLEGTRVQACFAVRMAYLPAFDVVGACHASVVFYAQRTRG